jgi:hypothetical protein
MKSVFKYELSLGFVKLPKGAELCHVGLQFGKLYAWALVDPDETGSSQILQVAGTGWPIYDPENWTFHSTYLLDSGALVLHVFTRKTGDE